MSLDENVFSVVVFKKFTRDWIEMISRKTQAETKIHKWLLLSVLRSVFED